MGMSVHANERTNDDGAVNFFIQKIMRPSYPWVVGRVQGVEQSGQAQVRVVREEGL